MIAFAPYPKRRLRFDRILDSFERHMWLTSGNSYRRGWIFSKTHAFHINSNSLYKNVYTENSSV